MGAAGVPLLCLFKTGYSRLSEVGEAKVCKIKHAEVSTAEKDVNILSGEAKNPRAREDLGDENESEMM